MGALQEKMEASQEKIEAYQENMEVSIKSGQEEMKATVRASQEKMKAVINTIWSQLEETVINRVEDVSSSLNQKKQSLRNDMADTKKEPHEADVHSPM
jgi:predicted S18 family serine protease